MRAKRNVRGLARILGVLGVLFVWAGGALAGEGVIALSLPGSNWAMILSAEGFAIDQKLIAPGGTGVYFMASDRTRDLSFSGHLEKSGGKKSARAAREYFWEQTKKAPFRMDGVKISSVGTMETVHYMIREHQGVPLNQKNLWGYFAYEDCWGYMHVSKSSFRDGEEALLASVLEGTDFSKKREGRKRDMRYRVSDQHVLRLMVPETWGDEIRRSGANGPPEISLHPAGVPASAFLITPIWNSRGERGFNSPEKIKAMLEGGGRETLAQAVEKELSLKEIKGRTLKGYYFTLTDKAARIDAGDYKYMTQGGLGVGNLLLLFTVFTNEKKSAVNTQALELVTSAEAME